MRLSVTTVEAYRLWLSGDWMALEDLESTIRKDAQPNEAMIRGRAFHAVIEHPDKALRDVMGETNYEADGFQFSGADIDSVLALLPPGRVNEAKAIVEIDGITLVGKADALHGLDVYEAKLTGRLDVERYFDSFQWRAYLVLFKAMRVRYLLAHAYDNGPFIQIRGVLPMWQYRYPKLDEDVRRSVNECAEFIERRGLASYVADAA